MVMKIVRWIDRWIDRCILGLPPYESIIDNKHHPQTSYIILIQNIIINSIITYLEFDAQTVFKMLTISRLPKQNIPN